MRHLPLTKRLQTQFTQAQHAGLARLAADEEVGMGRKVRELVRDELERLGYIDTGNNTNGGRNHE